MSEKDRRRTVLVTGAGGGLGRTIAEHLARGGDRVIGTVRDPARASRLSQESSAGGLDLRFVPLELASPSEVASLASGLESDGGVDVLVHNAGFGVFGSIEEVDGATVERQFAVNLFGPLDLTRRLLPGLRARHGLVVWIGSLAGRIALPFQGHYSATKAAIASISDAMRMELAPHGVRVTCIEPADFSTGFTDGRIVTRASASPYADALERCLAAVQEQEHGAPGPARVGRVVDGLSRLRRPPARRPVGQLARTMCTLLRLLPDRVRETTVRARYRLG